jgi:glyoxylase-like metal-dependent hydrolase (beta-lactamase superfamily II)
MDAVAPTELVPGVACVRDTCNVYVLRSDREAVLIDFGSGAVLDRLDELGVDRVTDVLVTHHHRDQVQGLALAAEEGIRIWVPPVEVDLIADVDQRWQARQIDNDYDLRQDRFSLLEQVQVAGTVSEYRTRRYGGFEIHTLPTPGHTIGSVTYLVETGGRRLAFTGDLLYAPGKVWSLAATQWSYMGVEGQAATHVSCNVLADHEPDLLLPSHGEPMDDPPTALALTRERLQEIVNMRIENNWDLDRWLRHPWEAITPHLLRNVSSHAHSYALLSDSGAALLIDWGYDLTTSIVQASERAARRPLLASLAALRRDFGVDRIEVVVTTHYHDDHVAGINLLRDIEGAEVWSPANVAPVLEEPQRFDVPCLWFDPVPVDRRLAMGMPVSWREYRLIPHDQPGHTLYAAAIEFEVDGKRVLATGDQQATADDDAAGDILNFQYRNRFRTDDYIASAKLYMDLRPDLLISGHWMPREVTDAYLERLLADGRRLAELHRDLLPFDEVDFGTEGFGARMEPYRSIAAPGEEIELYVIAWNPFARTERATVDLVVPEGWPQPEPQQARVSALGRVVFRFGLTAPEPVRRARVGADLTVGGTPFGQQAEALVDIVGD